MARTRANLRHSDLEFRRQGYAQLDRPARWARLAFSPMRWQRHWPPCTSGSPARGSRTSAALVAGLAEVIATAAALASAPAAASLPVSHRAEMVELADALPARSDDRMGIVRSGVSDDRAPRTVAPTPGSSGRSWKSALAAVCVDSRPIRYYWSFHLADRETCC